MLSSPQGESAKTRFYNDRIRAARSSMMNGAAENSLVERHAGNRAPQAGAVNNNPVQGRPPTSPSVPMTSGPAQARLPVRQEVPQQVDPLEAVNNAMRIEKFVSSPEMQQAVSKVKLRNFFRNGDTRDTGNDVPVGITALSELQRYL